MRVVVPIGYQASPNRAARRSDGPLSPPTQIGGCGCCTGLRFEQHARRNARSCRRYRLLLGPQRAERVDIFVGDGAAFGERRRHDGVELGLEPAGADPDRQPPAGQHIDRRELLGRENRRPVRHDQDRQHQPDARGLRREPGGQASASHGARRRCRSNRTRRSRNTDSRVGHVGQHDMVGEGQVVVAERLALARDAGHDLRRGQVPLFGRLNPNCMCPSSIRRGSTARRTAAAIRRSGKDYTL